MTLRNKTILQILIWLSVYPSVLVVSYSFDWLGIDWPMWAEIAVSTALTVPLIGLICAPYAEKLVAAAEGRTPAELKMDQAREADGPNPQPAE